MLNFDDMSYVEIVNTINELLKKDKFNFIYQNKKTIKFILYLHPVCGTTEITAVLEDGSNWNVGLAILDDVTKELQNQKLM